jgi:CheY-like chemotaxis protein
MIRLRLRFSPSFRTQRVVATVLLDTRELLYSVLTRCGAEVITASSAAEDLAAIDRQIPDVLLSDIGMPREDGYALLRKVRLRTPECGGNIPAAALTAYAKAEDRIEALAAGFQMHVPKPVDPSEVAAVVASLAGIPAKLPLD